MVFPRDIDARSFSRGLVLTLAPIALALGGCSSYSDPSIKVLEARAAERSAEGVVLNFVVEGSNPNDVALPLRSVQYSVFVNDQRVFDGVRSPEATLRRFGTREIELPAAIPAGQVPALDSTTTYRIEGVMEYTTPGALAELLFDNDLRRPKVTFSGRGTLGQASGG